MSVDTIVKADGSGRVDVSVRPSPQAEPDEAVVRVAWAGICGSDLDLIDGRRPPPLARLPVAPGHEWSGVVESVGQDVSRALLGAKVVGENIRRCRTCRDCREAESPTCESGYEESGFTLDGAWADRLVVPASLLHVLRGDADLLSAAGIEPGACAAAAVRHAGVQAGQRVAIVGGGNLGLLMCQLASAAGAVVTVIEPARWRAGVAKRCGASSVMPPDLTGRIEGQFDCVLEAAGAVGSADLAVRLARRAGRVVLTGIPPATDSLSTLELVSRNVQVRTVFGASRSAWRAAVSAFDAGTLNPGLLVTHTYALEDTAQALELVRSRRVDLGKVLLRPAGTAATR